MDPGHYTAYLLAIFICIILLLLAASALLLCCLRRNGFSITNRKSSVRLGAVMKNQSTSMTSFAWNFMDPLGMSLPITVDRSKQPTSLLSLDSHMLCVSDDEKGTWTSGLDSKSARKKSDISGQYSAFKCRLSSGASILGSVLERSSRLSLKAKRRSSSLKSGINTNILMVTLESPVRDSSLDAETFQAGDLPINLSRSSTLLCENSSDQQFTWNTTGLSITSDHVTKNETSPSAIENKPQISEVEGSIKNDIVQLRNPNFLKPKAWFVSMGNRPVSDGVQLEKKELNNVASLDSGVDTTEVLLRPGSCGLPIIPKVLSMHGMDDYVPLDSSEEHPKASNSKEGIQEVEKAQEDCNQLYITHQEAARKLNQGYSSRSLWEKREERPLIGVN